MCHRNADAVNKVFEAKQYSSTAFLDSSRALDKVWYNVLLYKVRDLLPSL